MRFRSEATKAESINWEAFTLPNLPLDELLEYCNPAPFGDIKEMKTVLDPEVRLAYEIESARLRIRRHPGMEPIKAHIEDKLAPGRHVELVLYKYSGDTSRIQWAAFYSDCIHEVKPVLKGHRVTITYNIITSQWSPSYHDIISSRESEDTVYLDEHFECSAESPSLSSKALANVDIELKKIQSQRQRSSPKVGLLLKHKYISKGLQPHLLKGEDKTLFDLLVNKQWKCELKSILSRYQTAAIYPYGFGEDGELAETHKIYEFNSVQSFKPVKSAYGAPQRRLAQENYRQRRVGIPFIEIYRKAQNTEQQLVLDKEGGGSWIGNEVEDVGVDKIYLDSAVIVELCKEL
ncbi:hypothetical protein ACROYT_G030860 [Oculina patagonica]